VKVLVGKIEQEQGRLDILVNDIWGGEHLTEWNVPVWEHSLGKGLRLLRLAIETHLVTSHYALPLLFKKKGGLVVEMTDGTADYNKSHYRLSMFYDLAKTSVNRMAWALSEELQPHGCAAVALTPGWMRSELMLDAYGVKEENWRDATKEVPHFAISETPRFTGRAVVHLASDPEVLRRNEQSLSSGQLAKVYGFTDIDGSQPDCWRYMNEIVETGKPADASGYR
jgi:NAD(P)-dependent dehydrogenase (short-subunit alcohol dehydrogenase family)